MAGQSLARTSNLQSHSLGDRALLAFAQLRPDAVWDAD